MMSWLKNHFVPNEGNDHRPHILRRKNTHYIVATVICLEIVSFLLPTLLNIRMIPDLEGAVLQAVLSDLTNEEREAKDLPILKVNEKLNRAAEMKAADMAAKGYFAHTSPEGKTPWYWIAQAGYEHQYAGENLAINFSDSKDVTNAWMHSPTHKENIIKEKYTEMGTGVAVGMYQGRETVFVAQVYANPLPKTVVKSQPTKTEIQTPVGATAIVTNETVPEVLGIEAEIMPSPTVLQKLNASPRHTTNLFLYFVFGIISIALILYGVLKIRHHHLDLITNGLVILALIGAVLVTNSYVSHHGMVITQSIDY